MTSTCQSHHFHVQRSKTGTSTPNCLLVANQQSGSHWHSLQIISTTGRMKAEISGSRLNVRIRHHSSHLKNQSSRETTKSVSPKRCHLSEIKSRHTKNNLKFSEARHSCFPCTRTRTHRLATQEWQASWLC